MAGVYRRRYVRHRPQPFLPTAVAVSGGPAFVQDWTNSNVGSQTGITVTISGPTSGNLLVAAIASDKNATVYTYPSGWTPLNESVSTSVSGAMAYKVSDGTETSVVWSQSVASPNGISAWVGEYENVDTLDATAEAATDETVVTSRSTGTTGTTAVADEMAVAMMAADTADSVTDGRAWSNGFSEQAFVTGGGAGPPGLSVADKVLSGTGTVETTFSTTDTGDQIYAQVATFMLSGGAAGSVVTSQAFDTVAAGRKLARAAAATSQGVAPVVTGRKLTSGAAATSQGVAPVVTGRKRVSASAATSLGVAPAVTGRKRTSASVATAQGVAPVVTSRKRVSASVSSAQGVAPAVTGRKLARASVATSQGVAPAVTGRKLARASVATTGAFAIVVTSQVPSEGASGSTVTTVGLATVVTSTKGGEGAVSTAQAFDTVVTSIHRASGAVATGQAFDTVVTSRKLGRGAVATAQALAAAVASQAGTAAAAGSVATTAAFDTAVSSRKLARAALVTAGVLTSRVTSALFVPAGALPRLHTIQYHAVIYEPDATGGPGTPKMELDPDALNMVWQQALNYPAQAAIGLTRFNPKLADLAFMEDHIKIFREDSKGLKTVFAGKVIKPDETARDSIIYCWDYTAFLQRSRTGFRILYPEKTIEEVVDAEWALAKAADKSPFEFVTTGTTQAPLGLDGVTPITTNSQFGVINFDRLFLFFALAELSMANTSNTVVFEITREAPHTFNFWKNRSTPRYNYHFSFPGNLIDYSIEDGHSEIVNDISTPILDPTTGAQVEYSLVDTASKDQYRRLQSAVAIKTLFGINAGTTESDQQKAALARLLTISAGIPTLINVFPRQGEVTPFDNWDLGDTFRTTIMDPASGDSLDAYKRVTGIAGAWTPAGGELLQLSLR